MIDEFVLATNITLGTYAVIASIVFWFTWRKRPDLIYWFVALLIYSSRHILLIFKQHNVLFKYLGNGIQLVALFVVAVYTFIEYLNIMIKEAKDPEEKEKEKRFLALATIATIVLGLIGIILLKVFSLLTLLNVIVSFMIIFLTPLAVVVVRIYLKQKSITRLFMFIVYLIGIITSLSTIFATYFEWGVALNHASNFIFMSFILTTGISAPIEQRITDSEEKYRRLSENLEEVVTERTIQLERVNKELESFSYSVSHDLKTPLRSISGFSKALQVDLSEKLDDKSKDYLERIIKSTKRMNELIEALLNLAQISRKEITITEVNLSEIAHDVMKELTLFYSKQKIEFSIEENIIARCDPKLIRVALENLFSNAIKFSKNKAKTNIVFGDTSKFNDRVFYVQDNGIGFNMKYYDKLFGLFQRLHNKQEYEGTGIGLITVKRIIERHKGQVWAESEEEKGSTFYFTIGT
jgi:signal transduction histidine kinase